MMSHAIKYGFHVLLIIFCFKIGSYTAETTTDQGQYNTTTAQSPASNYTTQTTPNSHSDSTSTTITEVHTTTGPRTCANLGYVSNIGNAAYNNWYIGYMYNTHWLNTSFWGGHIQIPWRGNIDKGCSKWPHTYLAMLEEEHVDISDIGEDVITVGVCLWNETDECIGNYSVEMRKCNGHLLYRIPWEFYDINMYYNTYVCFDRIYTNSCQSSDFVYSAGNLTDKFLSLFYYDIQPGWLNAHQNGKQYVVPSYDDIGEVFEKCIDISGQNGYTHLFLKEMMAQDLQENVPVRLNLCYVYKYYYDYYDYYTSEDYHYDEYCSYYVYARKCFGKIQFDVYDFHYRMCFIHYNDVKVVPEIKHTEDKLSDGTIIYRPYLQFRCSFEMTGSTEYNVKWYINGTFWEEIGPSSYPDDLVLSGDSLHQLGLGYQSMKIGEVWNSSRKYRFRLSTTDHDYDDKLHFDMELLVTKSLEVDGEENIERLGIVGVEVTHANLHRYKRCYSHADPHVRTADGRYFGQQRVGDHMLYRNKDYQSEVHEYARYCNGDDSGGAVCACGVAVIAGADVFVINRCGNYTILDFLQCNDGGIIDVQRLQDYRYKVTTPIGTVIIINLHYWGKTMDIDIYLSAKDFRNTDGLCGYFDGNSLNDFRHRNGSQSSSSNGYYYYTEFIDSWRLKNEENFLHNQNRTLEKWNVNNGVIGDQGCSNQASISKNKCQFERANRRRRDILTRRGQETIRKGKGPNNYDMRTKHGNSTVWASAHVDALNSIAATVISLSPDFASNNSESIKVFLSQTCTNNCSGHGICSESGLCDCEGVFRGPDCSIDLRIPPIIYDIHDGGICDTADGNDSDAQWYQTLVDKSTHLGKYEDIFTGECCVPEKRKRRSTEDSNTFVLVYDFVISNDGEHFGESKSVYVYDSTCIKYGSSGEIVTVVLKDNFCYISGSCVERKTTFQTSSDCFVCNPQANPYGWTLVDCNDDKIGLSTAALIGIIIGSVTVGMLVTVVIVYVRCYKIPKKRRTVCVDGINSSQAYLSAGPAREKWGGKK